ncbi:DUF4349 domain-containing protein [Rasiella rasia]|uniref:DUF4349 domain-containing protein n=2 Tax=Rasiella rasia TaxID=2744027 RepID=A0A6G6GQS6_9FLAO|nr:DUF4349 domain-containing protein [Rasiella rasia]
MANEDSDLLFEEIQETSNDVNLAPEQREAKIIKTANLAFESAEPEKTHQNILKLVSQYKGFIASDNAGKDYNRLYRNIVVRVPTDNFEALVAGISEGVPYYDQKTISRQDVTEEFVDLEARLKAKRELEKRYLELLTQAKNVKEMLEIERELSTIREEIEAKEGRLNYLQDRVSMSTVNIEFYKFTAQTGVTLSYGQKMKNALQGGWDGISVFFLGLLYIWPLFIVIIFIIFFLRWLLRRRKKK